MTSGAFAGLTVGAVVFLALAGFIVVAVMVAGEDWCGDRWPWWGPPENPASTRSGHSWERRHPGEFPWTMPR